MRNLNKFVHNYKIQLAKGEIQSAYSQLVKLVMALRTRFIANLKGEFSVGGLLQGYMDYTYFYYSNDLLQEKGLKLGLVLNHLEMRFEVWLLGRTKPVQTEYWNLFQGSKWVQSGSTMPQYSILEVIIVADPNFDDLTKLSNQIEKNARKTSAEIIDALKGLPAPSRTFQK